MQLLLHFVSGQMEKNVHSNVGNKKREPILYIKQNPQYSSM